MLTSDCTITHARVGTSTKRLVRVFPVNGGSGQKGAITPPTAPLECAILFTLQNPAVGFNRIFVRGFDSASVDGETLTPSSAFSTAAAVWENYLFTAGIWNIFGALGSSPQQYKMSALTPLSPRGFTATVDTTPGPVPDGSVVTIHRAKVPGYNGRKTVISQTTGAPPVMTFGGAAPATTDSATGIYLTIDTFFDQPVTQVFFEKVTRRPPGRPFGLVRGRSETLYTLR
jgi:hypothetical protein